MTRRLLLRVLLLHDYDRDDSGTVQSHIHPLFYFYCATMQYC